MTKRYFGKVTSENCKHPKYTDGEGMSLTAIGWKRWASLHGYVSENSLNNKAGKFIIYDANHNRTIKVLQKE